MFFAKVLWKWIYKRETFFFDPNIRLENVHNIFLLKFYFIGNTYHFLKQTTRPTPDEYQLHCFSKLSLFSSLISADWLISDYRSPRLPWDTWGPSVVVILVPSTISCGVIPVIKNINVIIRVLQYTSLVFLPSYHLYLWSL